MAEPKFHHLLAGVDCICLLEKVCGKLASLNLHFHLINKLIRKWSYTMQKHAYTIKEVAHEIGISRSKLYAEIKAGNIQIRKIGSRTIILNSELQRYLNDLPTGSLSV